MSQIVSFQKGHDKQPLDSLEVIVTEVNQEDALKTCSNLYWSAFVTIVTWVKVFIRCYHGVK